MNAISAYRRTQAAVEDPRSIEYRLLGQVTAALQTAHDDPSDMPRLVDVVMWNRKIWSVFRQDLLSPTNGLPAELKGQLVSLSLYVERESMDALSRGKDLEPLITVNRLVMEGLGGNPG